MTYHLKARSSPLSRTQCALPRGRDQPRPVAELCKTPRRTRRWICRLFSSRPLRLPPNGPVCRRAKPSCRLRGLHRDPLQWKTPRMFVYHTASLCLQSKLGWNHLHLRVGFTANGCVFSAPVFLQKPAALVRYL